MRRGGMRLSLSTITMPSRSARSRDGASPSGRPAAEKRNPNGAMTGDMLSSTSVPWSVMATTRSITGSLRFITK